MDNPKPEDSIIKGVEASFLNEAELYNSKLERDINTLITQSMADVGYVPLAEGTERYDLVREGFREAVEMELIIQGYDEAQRIDTIREFKLDSKVAEVSDTEAIIINKISDLLKEYIRLFDKGGLTINLAREIDATKQAIAILAIDILLLRRSNPVLQVLNHAIPGMQLDLDDKTMTDDSRIAIEESLEQREDESGILEFHNGLLEIVRGFDIVSDEDSDRAINEKDSILEHALSILRDNSIIDSQKEKLLDDLAATSNLGVEDAKKIIEYTREHRHLLE